MKSIHTFILSFALLFSLAACGSQKQVATTTPATTASTAEKEEVNTLEGKLEEIKDFMFILVDDQGKSYVFPFEEKPSGLDELKVGDSVQVEFTGNVDTVDAFNGKIISIKKLDK